MCLVKALFEWLVNRDFAWNICGCSSSCFALLCFALLFWRIDVGGKKGKPLLIYAHPPPSHGHPRRGIFRSTSYITLTLLSYLAILPYYLSNLTGLQQLSKVSIIIFRFDSHLRRSVSPPNGLPNGPRGTWSFGESETELT